MSTERIVISVSFAIAVSWACTSTTPAPGDNGSGGSSILGGATSSAPVGGSATGGAPHGGTSSTGGSQASGGGSSQGGANTTGGVPASGGVVASGGVDAAGGKAMGGVAATGGTKAVGGTKAASGGSIATGGANIGGGNTTTGGASVTTGGATGAAGRAPGGTTGIGGTSVAHSGSDAGGAMSCPATVMKSGDSNQKVGSRTFILHVPTGYTGTKPLPLVIDFHALGGTGSQQKGLSGWDKKGDSVGFVTAFPDSASNAGNGWNVGMCCQDAQKNKVDDAGFVRDMIQAIEALVCVDPKRIYVSGCSNGGGMSYKTACELADLVAAAAPVDFRCVYGGTTASPSCDGCKPARPISIIHFDNTGDTSLVPYNGGMTSFAADCPPNQSCTGMGFPSADANFTTWQKLDGCTGSASTDSAHSACKTNSTCEGSTQVTMCVQQGGSHCGNYGTLKIVDTAWDYFQKLSLP